MCCAWLHRCEAVTGGSEVKGVAEALDAQLSAFVSRLITLAQTLERQVGVGLRLLLYICSLLSSSFASPCVCLGAYSQGSPGIPKAL